MVEKKLGVGNGYQSQPKKDRILPQPQGHELAFLSGFIAGH
jgi:hypothetical protein